MKDIVSLERLLVESSKLQDHSLAVIYRVGEHVLTMEIGIVK